MEITLSVILSVLSVYLMQGVLQGVSPAMGGIAAAFPDVPFATLVMVYSLPNLTTIPASIWSGAVVGKKFTYKTMIIGALILMIITGIGPFFFGGSFTMILVWRALLGIGNGILWPLCAATVIAYFRDPEKIAKYMGYGGIVGSLSGVICAMLGGFLAASGWQNVWWYHLILLVSLVLVLIFLPELPKVAAQIGAEATQKEKISTIGWFYIIFGAIVMLVAYPFWTNIGLIIEGEGIGNAAAAGLVLSLFTVGGMVTGAIFGNVFKKLGKKTFALGAAICVVGWILMLLAKTIIMAYVASVVMGFGFVMLYTMFYVAISIDVAPALVSTVTGLFVASTNATAFLAGYMNTLLVNVFGFKDILRLPFYEAIIVFAFIALYYTLRREKAPPPVPA